MKCKVIHQELLTWSIDHKGEPLPPSLQNHVERCELCKKEWSTIQGWVHLLQPSEVWTPDEQIFQRLAENGMREKRRAAITDSTRLDLALDQTTFWGLFQKQWYRYVPVMVLTLILIIPSFVYYYQKQNTIGEFQYTSGQVIAQAHSPLLTRKGDPIKKGTVLQTPIDSQTIITLETGAEICIAERSRIVVENENTVRVELGKAYFDLPKQKNDFAVTMPNGMVRVLGTAFAVEVDHNGNNVVTVTRGLVAVSNDRAKIEVSQGYESTVQANRPPSMKEAEHLPRKIHWVSILQKERNLDDLRTYYPSLAAPTPKGNNQ